MSKIIRTLSLEGYLKSNHLNGYAMALCAPDPVDADFTTVVQEYTEPEYFPRDTRVNVATGVITAPASLKGYELSRHQGSIRDRAWPHKVLSIPEFNTFIRTLKA